MIGFLGLSHLGIVSGIAAAARGFDVLGFDPDPIRCAELGGGRLPIAEPGLEQLLSENRDRLRFTHDLDALGKCDLVVYALDVATDEQNQSDLGPLRSLLALTAPRLDPGATVVILCQVPPGFTRGLADEGLRLGAALYYQVETLIFGNAVPRALRPERFMVGCAHPEDPLPTAYARWLQAYECPVLRMRYESAELAKIAINMFLVSSVATTNTLAELCEEVGAEWQEIAPALRLDRRIGPHAYLSPGLGIAGGNLERDLVTVQRLASQYGTEAGIVAAWQRNSAYRRDWVLRKIHALDALAMGTGAEPPLAIWGLAYKPGTHSVKNSPALELLRSLAGRPQVVFDPQVRLDPANFPGVSIASGPLEACVGAAALIVMTPWPEFSSISPALIRQALAGRVVIDPFGVLPQQLCVDAGLSYHRLGTPG